MVAAVSASLPPVKFHVVAHSYGALIAARLLDKMSSLTLLSPAGCGEEINGDFIAAMLRNDIERAIAFLGETVPAEAQATLAEHINNHGAKLNAIAASLADDGHQKVSILAALAKATCPVQAVFLRDDAVVPANHALNLPFNVAGRIMPGMSHLPHWRDPDGIARMFAGLVPQA